MTFILSRSAAVPADEAPNTVAALRLPTQVIIKGDVHVRYV